MGKKHMTELFSFARKTDSYNALFDAEKCAPCPENVYN
jgi:hypothetical protein